MNPRYPAPAADSIWSAEARAHRLRVICDGYTEDALRRGIGASLKDSAVLEARQILSGAPDPTPGAWEDAEATHGHDMVGFLSAYLDRLPEWVHPAVHYGLTSSDLAEYDLYMAVVDHAARLKVEMGELKDALRDRATDYAGTPRAGRTHGQIAEATTLGHQFAVFEGVASRLAGALALGPVVKSPGPVGFGPRLPLRELRDHTVPSTQIIPRDHLLEWATVYLRISNLLNDLATFIRLGSRSEVGEFTEGGARDRVGSSAMPGKKNPIDSEKICGLARVARGQFLALSEVSGLWEDRDLSNSSTERIAVPGLAATVEHMLITAQKVVRGLQIDQDRIRANARDPRCRANARQCEIQRDQLVGPIEASRIAKKEMNG